MTKEQVEEKEKERLKKVDGYRKAIRDGISNIEDPVTGAPAYDIGEVEIFMERAAQMEKAKNMYLTPGTEGLMKYAIARDAIPLRKGSWKKEEFTFFLYLEPELRKVLIGIKKGSAEINRKLGENPELFDVTIQTVMELPYLELFSELAKDYKHCQDSVPKHFHGDIIITDPCYVVKDDDHDRIRRSGKWDISNILPNSIMRDTCYGDWSCTVFDKMSGKRLGQFCADAGLVAVLDLAEVLKYNQNFDCHVERPWTTALIQDFDGDVWFEVRGTWEKPSVYVVGKGRNIKTGRPVEFESSQTGL